MLHESPETIERAADFIQRHWPHRPEVGMVLGTGSGQIAEEISADDSIPYEEIPGFPSATAIGHAGRLVCGRWLDRTIIAMQGRFHLYEGYAESQIAFPILVMHRLGIERLLISNAAGGVNPRYAVGDIMLIESHVDLFFGRLRLPNNAQLIANDSPAASTMAALGNDGGERRGSGRSSCPGRPTFRGDQCYDPTLLEQALGAAHAAGIVAHRGTYVGLLGPTYETRSEYQWVRRIGGDAVGMSTIVEVVAAARCRIPTLAASIITNVAIPETLVATSGQAVVEAGRNASGNLCCLFRTLVES